VTRRVSQAVDMERAARGEFFINPTFDEVSDVIDGPFFLSLSLICGVICSGAW
jgi:hypothetical protein